jgi:hypothetical protein
MIVIIRFVDLLDRQFTSPTVILSHLWLVFHSLHRYPHLSVFNLVLPAPNLTSLTLSLPHSFPSDLPLCRVTLGVVSFRLAGGMHCLTETVSTFDKTEFGDVKLVVCKLKFPKFCLGVWLVGMKGTRLCSSSEG